MLSWTCRCKGALQLPFHKPFHKMTTHWSSSTNLDVLWREYKNILYWEAGVTGGHSGDIGGCNMAWVCMQYITCWQLAAAWGVTLKRSISVNILICLNKKERTQGRAWRIRDHMEHPHRWAGAMNNQGAGRGGHECRGCMPCMQWWWQWCIQGACEWSCMSWWTHAGSWQVCRTCPCSAMPARLCASMGRHPHAPRSLQSIWWWA